MKALLYSPSFPAVVSLFLSATVSLLLRPQGEKLSPSLPSFPFSYSGFVLHIPLLCLGHFLLFLLFFQSLSQFLFLIFCQKLPAYLRESAFRAGTVKGTSVLFFRFMLRVWFINVKKGQCTGGVTIRCGVSLMHKCQHQPSTSITPYQLNKGRSLSAYLTTLHLQTLETLVPCPCPLSLLVCIFPLH